MTDNHDKTINNHEKLLNKDDNIHKGEAQYIILFQNQIQNNKFDLDIWQN